MPKLPLPPETEGLRRHTPAVANWPHDTVLWRVHVTEGPHVVAWNALRHYGPVASGRFDPHEPPPQEQGEASGYFALAVPTVLAEVCQAARVINLRRGAPYLAGFRPTRVLSLLDLSAAVSPWQLVRTPAVPRISPATGVRPEPVGVWTWTRPRLDREGAAASPAPSSADTVDP